MRKNDVNLLWNFLLRTPMFIGKVSDEKIMSFLDGYEMGTENQCNFITNLSKSIAEEFGIKSSNTRLHGQVETLARTTHKDWITTFKNEGFKLLTKEFDNAEKSRFNEAFRKRIIGKINGINHHFRKDWILDWYEICHISSNWFKDLWSDLELENFRNIDIELSKFEISYEASDSIEPTDKLILLCSQLSTSLQP